MNSLFNQAQEFFASLHGEHHDGYITYWCKNNLTSFAFSKEEISEIPELVMQMNAQNKTVYVEVGFQNTRPDKNGRGTENNVSAVPALCIDIDIDTPLRKNHALPKTFGDAMGILQQVEISPNLVTWTGGGIQAYWLLTSPFIISNQSDYRIIKDTSLSLHNKVASICSEHHWHLDNIAALNHLVRIPGTFNLKYHNGISAIYYKSEKKYDFDHIQNWLSGNLKCEVSAHKYFTNNAFEQNNPDIFANIIANKECLGIAQINAINQFVWESVLHVSPPNIAIPSSPSAVEPVITSTPTPEFIEPVITSTPTPDCTDGFLEKLLSPPNSLIPSSDQSDDAMLDELFPPAIQTMPDLSSIAPPWMGELIDRCAFLDHCRRNSYTLSETKWFYMVNILAREENGPAVVHALSMNYPKYRLEETDQYIQNQLIYDSGPVTCNTIKASWNCNQDCGVTCPIHLKSIIMQEITADNDETESTDDVVNSQVLKERIREVPFPEKIYPDILLNSLRNLAKVISVEVDFVFCAALVVIGTAIGAKFKVSAKKGYSTLLNLWMAVIADTGMKKTPVFNALTKVLYEIQRRLTAKYERELRLYKMQSSPRNTAKTQTKASVTGKSAAPQPVNLPTDNDEPIPPPANIAVITTDPTVEALIERLKDSPKGLLRYNDEIKVLIDGFDKYKGKSSGELEIYLSLFNGTPIKVDRVEKTIFVPNPFLCILGGIQPQKLQASFGTGTFDDGFCARFLFYLKDDIFLELNRSEWTDQDKKVWENLINMLYDYDQSHEYTLGDEAWEVFKNYSNTLTALSGYAPNKFKGFPEKMETYSLRFAGIIHILNIFFEIGENTDTISKTTMEKAVELSNYFLFQARQMFEAYSPQGSKIDKDAQFILESILKLNQDTGSKTIPIAALLTQFNSVVDPSAVIADVGVFGKLVAKVMKESAVQYESKKVYLEDRKQKRCVVITDKSLSKINNILSKK
jgi:hypothetical protein